MATRQTTTRPNQSAVILAVIGAVALGTVSIVLTTPESPALAQSERIEGASQAINADLTEGTNVALALSPDGSRLVIDLQGTLWLVPLGDLPAGVPSQRARPLTDHWGDARQPEWSPDGQHIVFQSYRDGGWHLWTVRADGTELTQLTFGPGDDREPVYSPDGAWLAFASDRLGDYDIWLLEVATGALRPVTADDEANDFGPSFSPDGSRLAFVSERSPSGIYELDLAAGQTRRLASTDMQLGATRYSPSGRSIVAQAIDRQAGLTQLLRVDVEPGDDDQAAPPEALNEAGRDIFPFRVSFVSEDDFYYTADGKLRHWRGGTTRDIDFSATVTFERPNYERRPRRLSRDGARRTLGIVAPAASPDGSYVAFTALGDLWLLELDRSVRPKQLTDDVWVDAYPRWSPDSKRLIFQSDRGAQGQMEAWVLDIDSGELQRLDLPGSVSFPTFSPDGRRVAYFGGDAANPLAGGLKMMELDSGLVTDLGLLPIPPARISWGPDSQEVMVPQLDPVSSRYREGAFKLRVYTVDGDARWLAPSVSTTLAEPAWAPDGSAVAFVQADRLMIADVNENGDIGPPRLAADELASSPSWSAASSAVIYQSSDRLRRYDPVSGRVETLPLELDWEAEVGEGRLVIHAGRLFDGKSEELLENVDVVIEGDSIVAIHSPDQSVRDTADRVIDASEHTVMPGFFEMHAHQGIGGGEAQGRIWLGFGVTSVREPGSDPYEALERRESWASGRRVGPRQFFAGRLLDGGRVYYGIAEGAGEGRHIDRAIERAVALDYDWIKTYVRLSDAAQRQAVREAHRVGIPLSSHEIFPAAAHGMDAVEHVGATSRRGYSPKVSLLGSSYQDVIEIIARSGLNQTPTLVLPGYFSRIADAPLLLDNRQFQAFFGTQRAMSDRLRARSASGPGLRRRALGQGLTPARIVAAGGRVTAGTDSPFVPYGFGLHVEFQLMAEGGMTPFEVLRSATSWAAEACGVEDQLGSIEVGKLADIVIVEGNPLERLETTLDVTATVVGGRVFEVDDLLEPIE